MSISEFMTEVNTYHHHYRWGRMTKEELNGRLQKLAKKYDRQVFDLDIKRMGVKKNGND